MTRRLTGFAIRGAAVAFMAMFASTVDAGWWHHHHGSSGGSSGGSYGSYGSYGSHGSWGSSHGYRYASRWHGSSGGSYGSYGSYGSHGSHGYTVARYAYGHGSSGGSYGSSGGSSGGYYYGGSSGGSSGGSYYQAPVQAPGKPAIEGAPMDAPMDTPMDLPAPEKAAALDSTSATLTVHVPGEAKVYVNGLATRSVGEQRRYVSRGLNAGFSYTYEVRATVERNGEEVVESRTVQLRAGDREELTFAFEGDSAPETSLTVTVPEGAKVSLAGNETTATGTERVFRTSALKSGEEWSAYRVVVTLDRDGRTLTQEKEITLTGGEAQSLAFDFDVAQVADAR